jgi:predicted transcriptional regulator of viral defense system
MILHMSDLRDWMLGLPALGQYTFTAEEAYIQQPAISAASTNAALARAETAGLIVTPVRGFHVVVPLEDRGVSAPSWRLFLDPMMAHLGLKYYVGILTAATHHGASPQAAQVTQVVVPRQRRPVDVGRNRIEFVVWHGMASAPIELVNAPSGRYRMATPELTALDLVRYSSRAGGWGNVVSVLHDLAPAVRPSHFRPVLAMQPAAADIARLGYLLEQLGVADIAAPLHRWIEGRPERWVPLVPGSGRAGVRDPRWRIVINESIEPD